MIVRKEGILPCFSEILGGNYLKMILIPQNIKRNESLPTIYMFEDDSNKAAERKLTKMGRLRFGVRSKENTTKQAQPSGTIYYYS